VAFVVVFVQRTIHKEHYILSVAKVVLLERSQNRDIDGHWIQSLSLKCELRSECSIQDALYHVEVLRE
jgi:hypothetical protein